MGAAAGIKVGHAVHVVIGTMLGATSGLAAAMFLEETVIEQPEKGYKLAMAGATVGTVLGCVVGLEAGVVAAIAVVGALLLYSGMGINGIVCQGIVDIKHLMDALLKVIDMAGEDTVQAGISVLLGMMIDKTANEKLAYCRFGGNDQEYGGNDRRSSNRLGAGDDGRSRHGSRSGDSPARMHCCGDGSCVFKEGGSNRCFCSGYWCNSGLNAGVCSPCGYTAANTEDG
ncbi:UNVERIFIED_CONTAM: hypothetical protein FKN15_035342 [Acipenser sinensis]